VSLALLLGGCGPCELDDLALSIAGRESVDCGRVAPDADPTNASLCAVRAERASQAFRVRFDRQGIDSEPSLAIVRSRAGVTYVIEYDSSPCGGGDCRPRATRARCATALQTRSTPEGLTLWCSREPAETICD
jgi:hypothetical protein